jgi:hypothetical protein
MTTDEKREAAKRAIAEICPARTQNKLGKLHTVVLTCGHVTTLNRTQIRWYKGGDYLCWDCYYKKPATHGCGEQPAMTAKEIVAAIAR